MFGKNFHSPGSCHDYPDLVNLPEKEQLENKVNSADTSTSLCEDGMFELGAGNPYFIAYISFLIYS